VHFQRCYKHNMKFNKFPTYSKSFRLTVLPVTTKHPIKSAILLLCACTATVRDANGVSVRTIVIVWLDYSLDFRTDHCYTQMLQAIVIVSLETGKRHQCSDLSTPSDYTVRVSPRYRAKGKKSDKIGVHK